MKYEQALELFEPVIGLEVHVELNTRTKMFSSAPNSFGDAPNTNLTPVCLGLPGSLPVINEQAVRFAISLGLQLRCQIAEVSGFARKNYFYPDMAKNYQISQYDDPIAFDGCVEVELESGRTVQVSIERAHMEEDAGKLNHFGASGRLQGAEYSLVDYNRAGVPLVEIVTRPIFGGEADTPQIAASYVATIREMVATLGISDARMERGNLRCDANVSLRPRGSEKLGTRTETKNVNSLRAIESAVRFEIQRQAAVLAAGGEVIQQTRHWSEAKGETLPGRIKSDADDYRYFPEPDLPPLRPSPQLVETLRAQLPEHPTDKRRRRREAWGFSQEEFRDVYNADLGDAVENTVNLGVAPQHARKWWMGEISRIAKELSRHPGEIISAQSVQEVAVLVDSGKLNDKLARTVIQGIIAGEGDADEIVQARGLTLVQDESALVDAVKKAMAADPDAVNAIKSGKQQAAGALIGAIMKAMHGKADAKRVRELILELVGG